MKCVTATALSWARLVPYSPGPLGFQHALATIRLWLSAAMDFVLSFPGLMDS